MRLKMIVLSCIMPVCFIACAQVSYYAINIHYSPQKAITKNNSNNKKRLITVAHFNDARAIENKTIIGKNIKSKGDKVLAFAIESNPARSVSSAFKDFLLRANYTVDEVMPEWDLNIKSIKNLWGSLVIGGSIDELEVICSNGGVGVQGDTRVKMHVVFADVQRGTILRTITLESSSVLKKIRCTEDGMQEQLNSALSAAIEKLAENNELQDIMNEVSTVRSESLAD